MPHYSRPTTLLGASTSTTTSTPQCVADFRMLSLSIISSTGSSSRYTVWGTAVDGLQSPIQAQDWSVATTIVSQGVFTIDAGLRWMKIERDNISVSASSNVTMTLHGVVAG